MKNLTNKLRVLLKLRKVKNKPKKILRKQLKNSKRRRKQKRS